MWCREYLQVTHLSEITTPDGRSIVRENWMGVPTKHFRTLWLWPRSVAPSARAIAHWKQFIQKAYLLSSTSLRLRSMVSAETMGTVSWKAVIHPLSLRLLLFSKNGWREGRRVARASRRIKFELLDSYVQDPEGTPVIVKMEHGFALVEHQGSEDIVVPSPRKCVVNQVEVFYDTELSLIENLKRQPEQYKWAVERCYVKGSEMNVLESFRQGNLRAVTDGSHHPDFDLATAAVHVESEMGDVLTIVLQTPGHRLDLQSHRAELSGHYAIVTLVEILCKWLSKLGMYPESCGVEVGCDNKSSLRIYDEEYWFDPIQRDFDLLVSLHNRIGNMLANIKPRWVKGHQDKIKRKRDLDWWSIANIRCDNLAKAFLQDLAVQRPVSIGYEGWFAEEKVRIFVKGRKLSYLDKKGTYDMIAREKTVNWWVKHGRISDRSIMYIDWNVVGDAMSRLLPRKRRWVSKHMTENCGIGTTLVKWNILKDAKCPRCNQEDETAMHVFRCNHLSNLQNKEDAKCKLEKVLKEAGTEPEVCRVMVDSIYRWLKGETLRNCDSNKGEIIEAFREQSVIGWGNLFMGFAAKTWQIIQGNYCKSKGKRRTGRRWVIMVLAHMMNTAWDMWDNRCKWRHRKGNVREAMALDELDNAISAEYHRGIEGIPAHSRFLFDKSLAAILGMEDFRRKNWFRAVEAARGRVPAYVDNDMEDDALSSEYHPERKMLRKWLSTGMM